MTEENTFERAGLQARGFRFWMDKRGIGSPLAVNSLAILADELGVEILWENIYPLRAVVVKYPLRGARIMLHNNMSSQDTLFSFSRALGHIVEREKVSGVMEYSFEDSMLEDGTMYDSFSDEFAYELLLPTEELNALIQDGTPLDEIAKMKGVSVVTVVNRWDVVRMRSN